MISVEIKVLIRIKNEQSAKQIVLLPEILR